VLRHIENLPIGEIAARTSRSNDAVRSGLCRVKRLLVDAVESGSVSGGGSSLERSLA
jgi:DNA-directed RNA polymerase specialized sigma24 family protein